MSESVGELWHRYRWWVIATAIVLLAAGARFESTQPVEAMVVGLGVPFAALAVAVFALRESARGVRIFAAAVALVVLVGAEIEIGHLFFPPAALASGAISAKNPDATLELSTSASEFEIEMHGSLGSGRTAAEENFVIELERGGEKRLIQGTFSKSGGVAFTRRRAPIAASPHKVDVDRQPVSLAGSGPLHAHLVSLTGAGARTLEIRVRPALPGAHLIELVLKALLAAAVVVQVAAARDGHKASFAAWVGIVVVLASYLPHHFSPDDPLGALTGAMLVSVILGGLGGLVVGWIFSSIAGKRASA